MQSLKTLSLVCKRVDILEKINKVIKKWILFIKKKVYNTRTLKILQRKHIGLHSHFKVWSKWKKPRQPKLKKVKLILFLAILLFLGKNQVDHQILNTHCQCLCHKNLKEFKLSKENLFSLK